MIQGRKPGDDITLMDTVFFRGYDDDKSYNDHLIIIYKDNSTGTKFKAELVNPDYEYFMAKPDKRVSYPRLFIPKEDVDTIRVPYKDLDEDIAKRLGLQSFYYENVKNGNRSENRHLHEHPDLFNSDMNIEDHYRFRFDKTYRNEPGKITKSFFDIETDASMFDTDDILKHGECPVNAISLILQEQQLVYVFLLKTKSNPLIPQFVEEVKSGKAIMELEQFVVGAVGGPEAAEKFNIHFSYKFLFYDEDKEIDLISDFFKAINAYKPDFALAWNMSFDMIFLIERICNLGYNPVDIVCHPDFDNKYLKYYIDERNLNNFEERGDFCSCSCYTSYIDQMIQFASRRKGRNNFISFKLDDIGEAISKVKKLDYSHITTNIKELFVFYNIMDTIVQYCIEANTGDIDYLFTKCNMNNTRYSKCHRQTVYLTNRATKEFNVGGFIIGNNVNRFNPKPTNKYPGAFVADPLKIATNLKIKVNGSYISVHKLLIDMDFKSLYPSEYLQFNMGPNTIIGAIMIEHKVHDKENRAKINNWSRAVAIFEDYQSHQWLEFCSRWLHLADYTTLYHEVIEFFTTKMNPANPGLRFRELDGLVQPMWFDIEKPEYDTPIDFLSDARPVIEEHHYEMTVEDYNELSIRMEEGRNAALAVPHQQFGIDTRI